MSPLELFGAIAAVITILGAGYRSGFRAGQATTEQNVTVESHEDSDSDQLLLHDEHGISNSARPEG